MTSLRERGEKIAHITGTVLDPSNTVDRRRTIVGLHYVRALATIAVVAVHASSVVAGSRYFGATPAGGWLAFGAGEIDLFFMMSGFIMVVSTYNQQTGLPRIDVWEFFRRRAVRILPMLWLSIVSYAAIRYIGRNGAGEPWSYVRAMLLWPVGDVSPWVIWTIRYEVLFYIVFGLCLIRYRSLAFVAAAWFVSPLLLFLWAGGSDPGIGEFARFLISPFNLEFGIGVAMGFAYGRIGKPFAFRFQLSTIVLVVLAIRALAGWTDIKTGSTVFVLAIAPLCLLALMVAVKTDPVRVSKPMVFLGDASYAIFLFHPHFISPVLGAMAAVTPWLPPSAAVVLGTAISIALASLVHVAVEKPLVDRSNVMLHTIRQLDRAAT